jgi:hypothetical protein
VRLAARGGGSPERGPDGRAQARLEHAEWLVAQGRAEEAEPLLAEARELFERLRAVPWLERLDAARPAAARVPAEAT